MNLPKRIPLAPIAQALKRDPPKPIAPHEFPNPPAYGARFPPATIENLACIVAKYRITLAFDEMRKRLKIEIPGLNIGAENIDDVALAEIISLAILNGLQAGPIPAYVAALADRNRICPPKDWILRKDWDGVSRLKDLLATIVVAADYPEELRDILVTRWLLSAVAAVMYPGEFKARGVLTFQGGQGIGKTSWFMQLIPEAQRASFLKVDHHLDATNKDSILGAIGHWLVEIGELDSTFKRDVARLKGFLTSTHDKVRRPYARGESEYPRRTVFCATVNDSNFLVDLTGNSRWWTVEVESLNYQHDIDMQQVFAELAAQLQAGAIWWLTADEEKLLDAQNTTYLAGSAIRDRLTAYAYRVGKSEAVLATKHLTATEILDVVDVKYPSNSQVRECGQILRQMEAAFGRKKKINGKEGWTISVFPMETVDGEATRANAESRLMP